MRTVCLPREKSRTGPLVLVNRQHPLHPGGPVDLTAVDSRLARPIRVKTGRYNQHISDHCLLVEIGHNCNSLDQALAAVPYLAEALAAALTGGGQDAAALSDMDASVWSPAA